MTAATTSDTKTQILDVAERLMAEKLGLQPQQIWPERYDEFGTPLRQRGRPALKAVTTTKDSSIAKGDEERAA